MKINPGIFKSYDIRGIYPGEINKEIAYKVGQAFVSFVRRRKKVKKLDILLGRDNRLSSPAIFGAISSGIMSQGANVIDLGVCTTPMFYFASQYYRFDDGGTMITASHLSKEYNGFKMVKHTPIPVDYKSGLREIKKMAIENNFRVAKKRGKIIKKDILEEYIDFNLKDFDLSKIGPFKIVVDTGNTSTGLVIPGLFKKTKCRIFHLFPELDGNFPNRPPDCMKEENLKKLQKEVLKRKADFGVAFDGDGDRIVFVDEKGKLVSPNIITALMAKILLTENPKEKILYTIRGSRIISETVKKNGGMPVIWQAGHSNIKRKMRKDDILFGGEVSGHYYARDHYFSEAPFFVLSKILERLSKTKKTISSLTKPYDKYFNSGEINFETKNRKKVLKILEDKFRKGKIIKIDGLRVDFPDWWFNVRHSRTEPLLRLVVEAKTKKLMTEKKKELTALIK